MNWTNKTINPALQARDSARDRSTVSFDMAYQIAPKSSISWGNTQCSHWRLIWLERYSLYCVHGRSVASQAKFPRGIYDYIETCSPL